MPGSTASTTTPTCRPGAGDRLVLSLAVTRSDTGGPLAAGAIACSAIADARKLVGGSVGFAAGSAPLARCAWKLPRGLAGERVRASITVAFAGRLVTRTAAVTVR